MVCVDSGGSWQCEIFEKEENWRYDWNKWGTNFEASVVMLDILFLDKFVGAGKILISEFQNDILRLVW